MEIHEAATLNAILDELRTQTSILKELHTVLVHGAPTTTKAVEPEAPREKPEEPKATEPEVEQETPTTTEPKPPRETALTKAEIKELLLNYRSRGIDVGSVIKELFGEGKRFRDLDDDQLNQLVEKVTNKYKED